MEEKEKIITVVDKRHFTKDGTRRSEVQDDLDIDDTANSKTEEKREEPKNQSIQSDPSFGELVMFIVHNALAALGKLKGSLQGGEVNLEAAATMIEWLDAIQRKSEGNLSKEEEKILRESIYELKVLYVEARQGKK